MGVLAINIIWPICAIDIAGLLGGLWVVWIWQSDTPTRWTDTVRLSGWAMILAMGAAMVGLAMGSGFTVLRLWCHVLFCVLAPLLILRGLWWMRGTRARGFGMILLALGLSMEGVYVYARRVEPFALETNTHVLRFAQLRGMTEPVRVLVLADLQTDAVGPYEARALDQIDELKPDLLLLAGDYLQVRSADVYMREQSRLLKLVRRMRHKPKYGAFAVMGDTDRDESFFAGTHIRMLTGEAVPLPGVPIQVLGLAYGDTFSPLRKEYWKTIEEFEGLTIVLGHRPDFMLDVVNKGPRASMLGVAGHTHGGQIVVPGFGPPMTLTRIPRKYASGVHQFGDTWMCVSRGVGMERLDAPRIRLFCPPELVVLELRAK